MGQTLTVRVIKSSYPGLENRILHIEVDPLRGLVDALRAPPLFQDLLTLELIQEIVARNSGLTVRRLCSRSNSWRISRPRHLAMFLARELTDLPLQEIGRAFGGKHHSTVIHAIAKVRELRRSAATAKTIDTVKQEIQEAIDGAQPKT